MSTSDSGESLEALNDELYKQGATDGLPVVPPTRERIDEMLRGTDLPRDQELAVLGEREGVLTVEKLAANAVMAGCYPPHMPVLIAATRAMADPASNIDRAAVDPGSWAYQWIVNGPVREALDIRSDTGAFGPGFRANRAIGRALGLAYRNTALIDPRHGDRSVQGNPFKYTLVAGENEEASPWEPHHVTDGYDEDESTITFSARRSNVQFIPFGMTADGVLQAMQANTTPDMVGRTGAEHDDTVVHTVAPYNAAELDDAGLTKQDVKEFLCDNSEITYGKLGSDAAKSDASWTDKVTPLQTKQIEDPDLVQVYVIGGSGRFNGAGRAIGGPVTQPIEFPDGWDTLVAEYAVEREWGQISQTYDEMER